MKFGNKKPEKIPMYVYYIIAGVIIVLLNMLVVPARTGTKRAEDGLFYVY